MDKLEGGWYSLDNAISLFSVGGKGCVTDKAIKYDEGKPAYNMLGRNYRYWLEAVIITSCKNNLTSLINVRNSTRLGCVLTVADTLGMINLRLVNNSSHNFKQALTLVLCQLEELEKDVLERSVDVFAFGAKKYAQLNYALPFDDLTRLTRAAKGHLKKWCIAKDLESSQDEESHISHLAHTACCVLMLLEQLQAKE